MVSYNSLYLDVIFVFSGKAARSEKYDRITKQAGEVFGLGESPLLLRVSISTTNC